LTVGGAPLVIKLLEGTQGIGVVLAETRKAAESVIEAFRGLDANILVQEFIKEAGGSDIRAFVVGDRVVASMRRNAAPGEFRSNLHRGGSARRSALRRRSAAPQSAPSKRWDCVSLALDMLRSNHGPVIMEVNSSPGLEGIEGASGKDVAGAIIEHIERQAGPNKTKDRIKG
jgi:ribosomal protein S6--L-glutamate ligase